MSAAEPEKRSFPLFMKKMRLQRSICSSVCVVKSKVWPLSQTCLKSDMSLWISPGSNPAKGSSRKTTVGEGRSSMPKCTRFASPPDNSAIRRSDSPAMSRSSMTSLDRSSCSAAILSLGRRRRLCSRKVSCTVNSMRRRFSWVTNPMADLNALTKLFMGRPL